MAFPTVVVVKEDGSSQTVIDVTMEDEYVYQSCYAPSCHNETNGGDYCALHQCLVQDEGDVYEATTEEIECEDDEIDDDVMPLCEARGCMEPVTGRAGTSFCHEHRCFWAFCKYERDAGYIFCCSHRPQCAKEGCTRKLTVDDTILGTKFCGPHQCRHPECALSWDDGCEGFCIFHMPMQLRGRQGFCAFGRCGNYPLGSLVPFCALHAQRNSDL